MVGPPRCRVRGSGASAASTAHPSARFRAPGDGPRRKRRESATRCGCLSRARSQAPGSAWIPAPRAFRGWVCRPQRPRSRGRRAPGPVRRQNPMGCSHGFCVFRCPRGDTVLPRTPSPLQVDEAFTGFVRALACRNGVRGRTGRRRAASEHRCWGAARIRRGCGGRGRGRRLRRRAGSGGPDGSVLREGCVPSPGRSWPVPRWRPGCPCCRPA
jgi:hypothetical protein